MGAATRDTNTQSCPHAHWKAGLLSFPSIHDVRIFPNMGMLYTVGKFFIWLTWGYFQNSCPPDFGLAAPMKMDQIVFVLSTASLHYKILLGHSSLGWRLSRGVERRCNLHLSMPYPQSWIPGILYKLRNPTPGHQLVEFKQFLGPSGYCYLNLCKYPWESEVGDGV